MRNVGETSDEVKARVIEKCLRAAAVARSQGNYYLASVREAQALVLNETLQPHHFLREQR